MTLYLNCYIHIAWANSEDGSTDFTTKPDENTTYSYIGFYSDYSSTDSSDCSSYTWSALSTASVGSVTNTTYYYLLTDLSSLTDTTNGSYTDEDGSEYVDENSSSYTDEYAWYTEFTEPTSEKPYVWRYAVLTLADGTEVSTEAQLYARYNVVPFSELSSILEKLANNTTKTAYEITVSEVTSSVAVGARTATEGTLQYVLQNNLKKYVALTLEVDDTVTSIDYMFYGCTNLVSFNSTGLTNVTSAQNTFGNCTELIDVDTSGFISVTNAEYMFRSCIKLSSLDMAVFAKVTNANWMFMSCRSLPSEIDISTFVNVESTEGMFCYCDINLTSVNMSNLSKVTTAYVMFQDCYSLKSIDVSDLTSLKDAQAIFSGCSNLIYITGGEVLTSNITSYSSIFNGCTSLKRIFCNTEANTETTRTFLTTVQSADSRNLPTDFDVSTQVRQGVDWTKLNDTLALLDANTKDTPYEMNVLNYIADNLSGASTAVENTFQYILQQNSTKYITLNCILDDDGNVDYSAVYVNDDFLNRTDKTDFSSTFCKCGNLVAVALGEKGVTKTLSLFEGCSVLKNYYLDVSNVTNAGYMFYGCTGLTSIDTSAFTSVTNAEHMFMDCKGLTNIDTSGLTSVIDAFGIFAACTSLTNIDMGGLKSVTNAGNMFISCSSLEKITNWAMDLDKVTTDDYVFYSCPDTLEIYLKDEGVTKDDVFSLVRLDTDSSGTLTVTKQSTDETEATTVTDTVTLGDTLRLNGRIDEIAVADEISDDNFNNMFNYRYAWSNNSNDLQPSDKNFVIWADTGSVIRENITELDDDDFDEIFA